MGQTPKQLTPKEYLPNSWQNLCSWYSHFNSGLQESINYLTFCEEKL